MCGIVGIVTTRYVNQEITDLTLSALKHLEYRGYDSAGLSWIIPSGQITTYKEVGPIINLQQSLPHQIEAIGTTIAHTRWATHGKPNSINAHPHVTENVSIVHNGIIENYLEIKEKLIQHGHEFCSQTDSEVIARLIDHHINHKKESANTAFYNAISQLSGSFAIVAIFKNHKNTILFAKQNSPLLIGREKDILILTSDLNALMNYCQEFADIPNQSWGAVQNAHIEVSDFNNKSIQLNFFPIEKQSITATQNNYQSFLEKEINEQSQTINKLNINYVTPEHLIDLGKEITLIAQNPNITNIKIIACGSSYNAGLVCMGHFEKYALLNTDVYMASEFKYRFINWQNTQNNTLFIILSQSGETADTVGALERINQNKQQFVISITNNPYSAINRNSKIALHLYSGQEISVASTKAFTSQVHLLNLLALFFAHNKRLISNDELSIIIQELLLLPENINKVILKCESAVTQICSKIVNENKKLMIVGKGIGSGLAYETALKIKELSYLPVDCITSGELKHGHLAVVDKQSMIIIQVANDNLIDKSLLVANEIIARDGEVCLIGPSTIKDFATNNKIDANLCIPIQYGDSSFSSSVLNIIPAQIMAKQMAHMLKNEIDKPRNLAKSVTVE